MDPKDRMIIMIVISYIFMFIGFVVAAAYVLRRFFGFSYQDVRDYSICGTLILVVVLWFSIWRKTDTEFKRLKGEDRYTIVQ
jgi:hypothetical protein